MALVQQSNVNPSNAEVLYTVPTGRNLYMKWAYVRSNGLISSGASGIYADIGGNPFDLAILYGADSRCVIFNACEGLCLGPGDTILGAVVGSPPEFLVEFVGELI